MPAWALGELQLPDDLVSLVLQPFERFVVSDTGEGDHDFDALGLEAHGLAGEVAQARSPNSPGGVQIVHSEVATIRDRARPLAAKLRRVA